MKEIQGDLSWWLGKGETDIFVNMIQLKAIPRLSWFYSHLVRLISNYCVSKPNRLLMLK